MAKWDMVPWENVLEIKNGKNQKSVENPVGKYPIYGSGGVMGFADNFLCPPNTTVIGRKGSINKPLFVEEEFWNVDTAFGLVVNKVVLTPKYLFYFCLSYDFEKHNKTVTIPSLTKGDLLKIKIPLPPLEIQQRIADTLDCASDLVKLHKAQLEELDNLIQSVFYDMFGDPVTNEMGWGSEVLCGIASLKAGKNIKAGELFGKSDDYPYPCYGGNGIRGYLNMYSHDGKYSIIGRQGALCGNVQYTDGKFYPTEHAVVVSPTTNLDSLWLYNVLVFLNLNRLQTGAAQPGLNIEILSNVVIILPPLPLQTKFAEIVTSIEEQKSKVREALKEAEDLLAALMQEYFE